MPFFVKFLKDWGVGAGRGKGNLFPKRHLRCGFGMCGALFNRQIYPRPSCPFFRKFLKWERGRGGEGETFPKKAPAVRLWHVWRSPKSAVPLSTSLPILQEVFEVGEGAWGRGRNFSQKVLPSPPHIISIKPSQSSRSCPRSCPTGCL